MRIIINYKFEFKRKADRITIDIKRIQNYTEFFLISGRRDQVLLKMPFINKTRLTLSHPTEDGYLLLTVFNKERRRRALILISNYLLNVKETEGKTVLLIIVLEPLFITEN